MIQKALQTMLIIICLPFVKLEKKYALSKKVSISVLVYGYIILVVALVMFTLATIANIV